METEMLDIGRVLGVHPESNSVDVVLVSDGRRLVNVRVSSTSASGSTGRFDLPDPELGVGGKDPASSDIGERELLAVIGFTECGPICLAFVFPQVSQLMFTDRNRKIDRHVSDVYSTVDGNGNFEFYHPSGAYVRIASSPEHEDLTGKDFDKRWKINSKPAGHIHVQQAGGTAFVNIDPSGNVTVKSNGNMDFSAAGKMNLTAGDSMTFKAPRIDLNP